MKHKLILIFSEDSEVLGVDKALMFNNQLDAEMYLLSMGHIVSVKIELEDNRFYFKTNLWSGNGKAFWVVDRS